MKTQMRTLLHRPTTGWLIACLNLWLLPLQHSTSVSAGSFGVDGRANVIGADLEARAI
jgi:hypothetical protein